MQFIELKPGSLKIALAMNELIDIGGARPV